MLVSSRQIAICLLHQKGDFTSLNDATSKREAEQLYAGVQILEMALARLVKHVLPSGAHIKILFGGCKHALDRL